VVALPTIVPTLPTIVPTLCSAVLDDLADEGGRIAPMEKEIKKDDVTTPAENFGKSGSASSRLLARGDRDGLCGDDGGRKPHLYP
jgi:hypothetical protein